MEDKDFDYVFESHDAARAASWLRERDGVAVWASVDLSRPGQTSATPVRAEDGSATPPPHWMYGDRPERIVTDADRIGVELSRKVGYHSVHLRPSQNMLVLTDQSQAAAERRLEKLGKGSHYVLDGDVHFPRAMFFQRVLLVPLPVWLGRYEADLVGSGPGGAPEAEAAIRRRAHSAVLSLCERRVLLDPQPFFGEIREAEAALLAAEATWISGGVMHDRMDPTRQSLLRQLRVFAEKARPLMGGRKLTKESRAALVMAMTAGRIPDRIAEETNIESVN